MKKLILLLILSVSCLFTLTACFNTGDDTSTPDDDNQVVETDEEVLAKAVSYVKQKYYGIEEATTISYKLIANIPVPGSTITWAVEVTSGDENAVKLNPNKVLEDGIEYYEVVVSDTPASETFYKLTATISVGELNEKVSYERKVPEYVSPDTTIAYLANNKPASSNDKVYFVTGIWTAKDGMAPAANTFGNGFLSDEEGNQIVIYGLSGTKACLSQTDGVYKYSNSKDFPTLGINDGAVIKVGMVYTANYDNYSAYLIEIVSNGTAVEPDAEPAKINTTIAELVANKPAEEKAVVYVVTGTWTAKDGMEPAANTFGNGFLTDAEGNQIVAYGFSGSAACCTWGGSMYVYSNAKDFPTLGINDGDVVTVGMVYTPKFDNYSLYLISKGEGGEDPNPDDKTPVQPDAEPEKINTTITELVANKPAEEKAVVYIVTGTWTAKDGMEPAANTFGNGFLTDAEGNQIVAYGFSGSAACCTWNGSMYVYTNAKDFPTLGINDGDVVTVGMVYTPKFDNYSLYLISKGEGGETPNPDDKTPVDPNAEPAVIETTVAALAANKPAGNLDQIYVVEGIWTTGGVANSANAYGNGTLIDENGNSIKVYGLSSSKEACLTYANGVYTYDNPKDFASLNLAEYVIIKVGMVYTKQFDNYSLYLIEVKGAVSDELAVSFDKEGLKLDNSATSDLALPTVGHAGSTIAWSSSNEAVISAAGVVTRPAAGEADATVTLTATITKGSQTATVSFEISVKAELPQTGESQLLATFTFGDNKNTTTHVDGSEIKAPKSYNNNGYTLEITAATKAYDGANDATGKSALKFGTSKLNGSITFTVGADVNKVVIYVAQYKANATVVDVNGTKYTISTASNSGAYTAIEIDTTTVKTIVFATSGTTYRAMVDAIEFHS